jgi:hypothetical protein
MDSLYIHPVVPALLELIGYILHLSSIALKCSVLEEFGLVCQCGG